MSNKAEEIIDVRADFARVRRCLVLMPAQQPEFKVALAKLEALRASLPDAKISCYIRNTVADTLKLASAVKVFRDTEEDFTFFGIPRRSLVKKVFATRFDLIIDLNQKFDSVCAFLSAKSGARLRICFSEPERDPFYNFQIRTTQQQPYERNFDLLLKYLHDLVRLSTNPLDRVEPLN